MNMNLCPNQPMCPPMNITPGNNYGLYPKDIAYLDPTYVAKEKFDNHIEIEKEIEKANIRKDEKAFSNFLDTQSKIFLMEHKADLEKRKNFDDFQICISSDGLFCVESYRFENRKREIFPVCDAIDLVSVAYESYFCGKKYVMYKIYWRQNENGFYLKENEMTSKSLIKKLANKNYPIRTTPKYISMVASLIMRYLKNNSQKIYIPYATGWTQNEKGAWKLTKPNELTMKEILKNV